MAILADAEWGGPPDHEEALPGPPQAPGWEWELDAYGVPVPNRSTPARAARRRRLRVDTDRPLPPQPALRAAVVACMDSRLNVFGLLGMGDDEAQVIRNAGGVVTDDEIRSLAISQRLLGTEEIILIHHTDCGMLTFTDDEFKASIQQETGIKPEWAAESFSDLETDVRQSIARIKASPFIRRKDSIRGFIYEVETGRLREVD